MRRLKLARVDTSEFSTLSPNLHVLDPRSNFQNSLACPYFVNVISRVT